VATLVHIHGAQTEAKDVVLACLAGALAIALAIDELLVMTTLGDVLLSWLDAGSVVVNHAVWAHRCADIALGDCERRWALREPALFALLAVMTFFVLTISTPK